MAQGKEKKTTRIQNKKEEGEKTFGSTRKFPQAAEEKEKGKFVSCSSLKSNLIGGDHKQTNLRDEQSDSDDIDETSTILNLAVQR